MNQVFLPLVVLAVSWVAVVSPGAQARGPDVRVVADVAHAAVPTQRTVLDEGPTGFSRLWKALGKGSSAACVNYEPLSPASLANVDVLVITTIAPAKKLTLAESTALRAFIERGGVLLLTNNDLTPDGIGVWVEVANSLGIQSVGAASRLTAETKDGRTHISRYSGGALNRWMGQIEDGPLYAHGVIASPVDGTVLISYDGASLAARKPLGHGCVYALGGGDMIGNRFVPPESAEPGDPAGQSPLNRMVMSGLVRDILAEKARHKNSNK